MKCWAAWRVAVVFVLACVAAVAAEEDYCRQFSSTCGECTAQLGCGWCHAAHGSVKSSYCVNGTLDDGATIDECNADVGEFTWSGYGCEDHGDCVQRFFTLSPYVCFDESQQWAVPIAYSVFAVALLLFLGTAIFFRKLPRLPTPPGASYVVRAGSSICNTCSRQWYEDEQTSAYIPLEQQPPSDDAEAGPRRTFTSTQCWMCRLRDWSCVAASFALLSALIGLGLAVIDVVGLPLAAISMGCSGLSFGVLALAGALIVMHASAAKRRRMREDAYDERREIMHSSSAIGGVPGKHTAAGTPLTADMERYLEREMVVGETLLWFESLKTLRQLRESPGGVMILFVFGFPLSLSGLMIGLLFLLVDDGPWQETMCILIMMECIFVPMFAVAGIFMMQYFNLLRGCCVLTNRRLITVSLSPLGKANVMSVPLSCLGTLRLVQLQVWEEDRDEPTRYDSSDSDEHAPDMLRDGPPLKPGRGADVWDRSVVSDGALLQAFGVAKPETLNPDGESEERNIDLMPYVRDITELGSVLLDALNAEAKKAPTKKSISGPAATEATPVQTSPLMDPRKRINFLKYYILGLFLAMAIVTPVTALVASGFDWFVLAVAAVIGAPMITFMGLFMYVIFSYVSAMHQQAHAHAVDFVIPVLGTPQPV